MLIGVAAFWPQWISRVVFYLIAYLVTNLAAFGIISLVSEVVKPDEINAYTGYQGVSRAWVWPCWLPCFPWVGFRHLQDLSEKYYFSQLPFIDANFPWWQLGFLIPLLVFITICLS